MAHIWSSKPGMISRLGALLVETPWLFMSRNLLEECRTFVSHPGGRTGAANGAHDDCLMAMALAHAVGLRDLKPAHDAAEQAEWRILLSLGESLVGSAGGAGYPANAGRSAEPVDAGARWQAVGGEVPNNPQHMRGAGQ